MEAKPNEFQTNSRMSISHFKLAQTHMRAAQLLAAQPTHSCGVVHFLDIALFNAVKSILLTKGIHINPEDDYSEALHSSLIVDNSFPASYAELCSTINALRMQLEWDIDVPVPEQRLTAEYLSETTRLMSYSEQYLIGYGDSV